MLIQIIMNDNISIPKSLKLQPNLKFSTYDSLDLLLFSKVLKSKCKAQYQQWHQVLQELQQNSGRLIAAYGRCLNWCCWIVLAFCWKSVGVNLPDIVLFHHFCCRVTVANIFEIGGGILPCVKHHKFQANELFSMFLY